ncbi:MAG: class I SAM-dependent methyltransferase, partial [Candidatus Desantisbacteria bacterium]
LCQLMSKLGDVMGCDISEIALELCSKRKVAVFHADLNTADLGIERYDVITSIDVLYHQKIQNDSEVLSRFHRALKPGGILILNLPAYNFLKSRHDLAVHTRERYTKSVMMEKLKETGLGVEKATYRIGFLFPIIALYRFMQHSDKDKPVSDVNMPPKVINSTVLALNRMENWFIEKISSIPFGTSLFIVARKLA